MLKLHDLPPFSLAAICTDVCLLQGKKLLFSLDILVIGH